MTTDAARELKIERWKSHPGADQVRAALKDILKLQQDLLELDDPEQYFIVLAEMNSWTNLLMTDDVSRFDMVRIFEDYLAYKHDYVTDFSKRRRTPISVLS